MSTLAISASDVNKLRQQTGAGMMDCKKALTEANGDFEAAVDYLRKKGQKVAANRSDRDAKEGFVFGQVSADGKFGAIVMLNCETDFVAINEQFIAFGKSVLNLAVENKTTDIETLKGLSLSGLPLSDHILDMVGKIGEKIEINELAIVEGNKVVVYNHPGNRLTALVALSSGTASTDAGKDVAMQIAAMKPIAISKDDVSQDFLNREMDIAREQARGENKPEEMVEKIAQGKVAKILKEETLLNQAFIKDDKKTIAQFLESVEKGLNVTAFKRVQLGA